MRSTTTAYSGRSSSRVPPSVASSAVMPCSLPRAFTVSMNGCGKVFSRPMRTPTFLDIHPHHLPPVRPVVGPAGPHVESHVDALLAQHPADPQRVLDVPILRAGRDDLLLHRAERRDVAVVAEPGEEG